MRQRRGQCRQLESALVVQLPSRGCPVVAADRRGPDHPGGPGLAAEDQERVFQPFARGESSEGGNGIGLATVQRILNAHRGRVWVAPDFTAGTRICFEIPDHVG